MPSPGGGVFYAEFMIENTRIYIYISDECEESHAFAMPKGVTASCLFAILVEDCDTAHGRAVVCGAASLSGPADQFWCPPTAVVRDPFGYRGCLSQRTEELMPAEIEKRARRFFDS